MRRVVVIVVLAIACTKKALPPLARQNVVSAAREAKPVLFIGLDGADWRMLDPLIADGTMPVLGALVRGGERRVLLTQQPPLSPLVWTSMMTGVSPLEHRILDFTRFSPATREREPITSDERAVPAIWNMATYGGKRVDVTGMWATAPAEAVNGTIVTDRDVASTQPEVVSRIDAQTANVHRAALQRLDSDRPDLAIVYLQGTDEIGHVTGGNVDAAREYFRRIDTMLGEYVAIAKRRDATIVIASDHGFDWGGAHEESSTAVATAAKWHRDEGIYLRWPGRGVEAPAHAAQLCATLLALAGLPPGEGLAPAIGAAVTREAFNYRRYFRRAPTAATTRSSEAVANLKALGYIGGSEPSRAPAGASGTRTPSSFNNEGLILRDLGRSSDAERAFASALQLDPHYASAEWNLSELLAVRDAARADALLVGAYRDGLPNGVAQLARRAQERRGDAARALLGRAIAVRDDGELRLRRGRYALEAQDCGAALADFRAASARMQSAVVFASIGTAEACLGHRDAAAAALDRSLALDANQPQVRAFRDSLR